MRARRVSRLIMSWCTPLYSNPSSKPVIGQSSNSPITYDIVIVLVSLVLALFLAIADEDGLQASPRESSQYCRIITVDHTRRIENLLQQSIDDGAIVRSGGEVP